jgi:hypothetical protein
MRPEKFGGNANGDVFCKFARIAELFGGVANCPARAFAVRCASPVAEIAFCLNEASRLVDAAGSPGGFCGSDCTNRNETSNESFGDDGGRCL